MTDSAVADHAASDRSSRRALLGAGVAALALAGSRPASAGTTYGLSDADTALAAFAISLELTARDLYDAAIAAGAADDVWSVMREQHEAYATRLAGLAGLSANFRIEGVFETLVGEFATSSPVTAAQALENTAAATHLELLNSVEDVSMVGIVAGIAAMESRHATVLGLIAGATGDALFTNPATPLEA